MAWYLVEQRDNFTFNFTKLQVVPISSSVQLKHTVSNSIFCAPVALLPACTARPRPSQNRTAIRQTVLSQAVYFTHQPYLWSHASCERVCRLRQPIRGEEYSYLMRFRGNSFELHRHMTSRHMVTSRKVLCRLLVNETHLVTTSLFPSCSYFPIHLRSCSYCSAFAAHLPSNYVPLPKPLPFISPSYFIPPILEVLEPW
jgi:hypothetical protein